MIDQIAPPEQGRVNATPPAASEPAAAHFAAKLGFETDPSDLWHDLSHGEAGIVVFDVRSTEAYREAHVPGARSVPHGTIDSATLETLPAGVTVVTYCWGPHCNGATKGALRLTRLGVPVKEMIGGIEGWRREGLPVDVGP